MVKTSLLALFGIFCLMSFRFTEETPKTPAEVPVNETLQENDMACEAQVFEYFYTSSARYKEYCDTLYTKLFNHGNKPSRKVFDYAMKGYSYFASQGMLGKQDILSFIDYSLSSNTRRFWVIDLREVKVLYHELVAHGRNTGSEFARKFSNKANSFQTSLGFFITGEIYNGKHELSVKMNGMERMYNSNALDRGIVIHGADYVSQDYIAENQRLGRSLGCPAVRQEVIESLSSVISGGTCIFAYYPHKTYLRNSKVLKSDVIFAAAK